MIGIKAIAKNSLALVVLSGMSYGTYYLYKLKPPRTTGLTLVGNYLVNKPAEEILKEECGNFVWEDKDPKFLQLTLSSWFSGFSGLFGTNKKTVKAPLSPPEKKNEMGKKKSEWEACIQEIPNKYKI